MASHRIDLCQRKIIVLILNQTENTVMPKALIIRIIAQGLIVILYRLGIFLLVDAAEATQLVGVHHIRVTFDGFSTVTLCPTEVIEIEFCHSSEEPRFKEPGFLTDGLIEILDGEHIVFIVESGTPHHHQTVGIELGP